MTLIHLMQRFLAEPTEMVTFSDDDHGFSALAEIHLTGTEQREEDGFVVKEILRTGEWPVIPTRNGTLKRPLKIIRDGVSSQQDGIIALSELVENFKKVNMRVQVPLSNDDNDHKNITALNTGYVRDIWIVDGENSSKLVAKIEFTEPEVKEKVLRGTYADVSCGIPWELTSRGQNYGATLEHVAITNRGFIDDLGPFLAMSDGTKDAEATHFSTAEAIEQIGASVDITPAIVDAAKLIESANGQIQKVLGEHFEVQHITASGFHVRNENLKTSWTIPFSVDEDGNTVISAITEWTNSKDEEEAEPGAGAEEVPAPEPQHHPAPILPTGPEGELEAARRLREARLGASDKIPSTNKEANMPLTREELEALNLSDLPEGQRAVFQKVLDENSTLAASNREASVAERVTELEGLGLKEFPGALKLYREVALADDGGPAVILSDNGTKSPKTAKSILDDFIEAIKGAEGKVHLSDQALVSGSDIKPPDGPEGEKKPLEERVAETRSELGLGAKK